MSDKLIRELRMGFPKTWKTGAVVGTYPRPLLCLQFDEGGLDVINDPIVFIQPSELSVWCKKKPEELPPITAIDFTDKQAKKVLIAYAPQAAKPAFETYVQAANDLVQLGCPWKTVVNDNISGISDAILAHIAAVNASDLIDARKWASKIGGKLHQIIGVFNSLPAHSVFIAHSGSPDKDEDTKEMWISLLAPSRWFRDRAGGIFSQYLYQYRKGRDIKVITTDQGFIKGIGCRWPKDLPAEVGPTYKDIYERGGK